MLGNRKCWRTDSSYLRCDAEHFERRRHIEVLGDADVAEIDAVSPTPDTQPFNVENGQIAGQSQNERFSVVAPKRVDFPILVRHLMALLAGLGTRTHPEECVYRISIMMGTECKFFFSLFLCRIPRDQPNVKCTVHTWSGSVVSEIRQKESLCVDDVDSIGSDFVNAGHGGEALRTRIVETCRNSDLSECLLRVHKQQISDVIADVSSLIIKFILTEKARLQTVSQRISLMVLPSGKVSVRSWSS